MLYTFIGSSRQLIVEPEGFNQALVARPCFPLAAAGSSEATELAATLALLVAACFLLAWVARLGWLADYFSRPVLVGYIHGVAVVLVCGQLGKLLGVDVDATKPVRAGRGRDPGARRRERDNRPRERRRARRAPWRALLVPRLPAALIVVLASILVSWAVDLQAHGVAVVGPIPSGLPSFSIPRPPLGDAVDLVPAAIGIFLVSFADGILTARSFAGKQNLHIRANQELLAFTGLNAAAGVTQSPLGASGSRTTVNDQMGAKTQIAGLVAAGAVALVLLFLTEPMSYLPSAVLGAVIVSAAIGLVDLTAWRGLRLVSRFELAIAAATLVGVVALGVLQALVIAVVLSILDVVRRSAQPRDAVLGWVDRLGRWGNVELHPSARVTPGVVVYRLDDRLFFANARYVKGRVREALRGAPDEARWLVFDAEAVSHVDATGLEALRELATGLPQDGVGLVVARMKPEVRERLVAGGVAEAIGEERFYPTVRAAVAACVAREAARPA